MVLGQELLDTFVPCSYNPSNYRINLKDNVSGHISTVKRIWRLIKDVLRLTAKCICHD
jgi:hypothetical protein